MSNAITIHIPNEEQRRRDGVLAVLAIGSNRGVWVSGKFEFEFSGFLMSRLLHDNVKAAMWIAPDAAPKAGEWSSIANLAVDIDGHAVIVPQKYKGRVTFVVTE
jgi:hypothetical protein